MRDRTVSTALLAWYDTNAHSRAMPWRVSPAGRAAGVVPDPYRIWMSEVMLQQTTVAAVKAYFVRFTTRWPTVTDLAAAADADVMAEWAGLGYYARARNLLKCARAVVADHGGVFPGTRDALLTLPGIGPYTASAIAAIAYDEPAVVVDGNVERVMARLFDIHTPLPLAKPELTDRAASLTPNARPGDYAQAVMDLGATICTPKNPTCGLCPVREVCAGFAKGTYASLPQKTPKKPKPTRLGTVYTAQRTDGAWLLETRPPKGLLGGMLGWPGSDWTEDAAQFCPPLEADWQEISTEVRHTFTHFHLKLTVFVAQVPIETPPPTGDWHTNLTPTDLPTVMRKVFDLATSA